MAKRKRKPASKPRRKSAPRPAAQTPARPAELIATTRDEAARLLGVSTRTLAGWMTDPLFPGTPGSPGRADGHFPIGAIRAWHLATHGPQARCQEIDEETLAAKKLKLLVDADKAQVELEKELGYIADALEAENFCRRIILSAKSLLSELPDRVNARLPAKIPAEVKRLNRRVLEQGIADVLNALAELVAGDGDDCEDLPDDE